MTFFSCILSKLTSWNNATSPKKSSKNELLQQTPFLLLISDLKNLIFAQCNPCDLGRLSCTNKTFQKALNEPAAWKPIAHRLTPYAAQFFDQIETKDYKTCVRDYSWDISQKELNCLALMCDNPPYIAGNYLPAELIRAIKAIQTNQPQTFSTENRIFWKKLRGDHAPERKDALPFLRDCVAPGAFERNICWFIDNPSQELERNNFSSCQEEFSTASKTITMTAGEVGNTLKTLSDKIEKRVKALDFNSKSKCS